MIAYEQPATYWCGACGKVMVQTKRPSLRGVLRCLTPECPEFEAHYVLPVRPVDLKPYSDTPTVIEPPEPPLPAPVLCDCAGARPFERLDGAPDKDGLLPYVCPCCGKRRMLTVRGQLFQVDVVEKLREAIAAERNDMPVPR